jgi:sensor c-di-GMP phosphodiesterase-like protein
MRRLLIPVCLVLAGCNIQKREVARLDTYSVKYPAEMARLSNWLYPCFTGKAKSDTVMQTRHDTVTNPGTVVITHVKDTVVKTVTLPGKTITNTMQVTIHDTINDQRAIAACQSAAKVKSDSLVVRNTQLTQTTKSRSTWMWIAIGCMVVIVVSLVVKVYSFISGGALTKLI